MNPLKKKKYLYRTVAGGIAFVNRAHIRQCGVDNVGRALQRLFNNVSQARCIDIVIGQFQGQAVCERLVEGGML